MKVEKLLTQMATKLQINNKKWLFSFYVPGQSSSDRQQYQTRHQGSNSYTFSIADWAKNLLT